MEQAGLENSLLTPVFDQIGALVDYSHISIYVLQGTDVTLLAYRGPVPIREASLFSFPLSRAGGARHVITTETPLLIADARGDSPIARSFLEATRDVPESTFDYIGSWIGLPLWIGGEVAGMLDLAHAERGHYTEADLARVGAYVQQVAVHIENAVLYADLSQRSQELQTLYAVQQAINSHLEISIVLQLVADQARRLTSAQQLLVFLVQDDRLWAAYQSGKASFHLPEGYSLPLEGSMIGRALTSGRLLRVFDSLTDPRVDVEECRRLDARSLLVVPLGPSDRPIGALVATNKVFGAFGPRDERVLSQLASGAAIALENARLYQDQWLARRAAEGLQEILTLVSSGQPLDAVLSGVLGTAVPLLEVDAGALYLPVGSEGLAALEAACGLDGELLEVCRQPSVWKRRLQAVAPRGDGPMPSTLAPPAPLAGSPSHAVRALDLSAWHPGTETGAEQPAELLSHLAVRFRSALLVPLIIQGEVDGLLELYSRSAYEPEPRLLRLAETIGRHVTYAVERGRLAEKAEELVRLQERKRIAQALHDTVAQMLFRIGIEAEWCGQHVGADEAVAQRIDLVRRLVSRSSYELRSAIFALRDRAQAGESSLVGLLRDLIQEFQEESGIRATLIASPDLPPPPPAAAEALYRIVREALSNVRKHARASAVVVSLRGEEGAVVLTVQDDGIGLDECVLVGDFGNALHFGIDTMRQLARKLGGRLFIGNNDDHGTLVKVRLPLSVPESTAPDAMAQQEPTHDDTDPRHPGG